MSSPALARFQASLAGRSEPELLVPIATTLGPAEREAARQTLLGMLAEGSGDDRVPEALAVVAPDHFQTLDALEAAVAGGQPAVRLGAYRALFRLTGVLNTAGLLALAQQAASTTVRQDAVRFLASHPTGRTEALLVMVHDADARVRATAFDRLLIANGLESWEGKAPNVLSMMGLRVGSRLLAVREEVGRQLGEVLAGLDQGRSPVSLGIRTPALKPEADSARMNLLNASEALDASALGQIRGESARWLIDLCLGLLDRGDPRIPRALVALRATRALPALNEVRVGAQGEMASAVDEAIAALG